MLITDDSRLLMQEATRMTKEVGELIFDLVYLAVIWTIVFKMYGTLHRLPEERLPLARTLALAFALLALGDTGHVGFRVVAHLAGGVEANPQLLGVGKLATAITVTVFYALLVRAWKLRYNKRYGILAYLLFISAAVRLSFMLLPGNQWARDIAPFDFSMHRNIPLPYSKIILHASDTGREPCHGRMRALVTAKLPACSGRGSLHAP
jgi:hypothetical protein